MTSREQNRLLVALSEAVDFLLNNAKAGGHEQFTHINRLVEELAEATRPAEHDLWLELQAQERDQ